MTPSQAWTARCIEFDPMGAVALLSDSQVDFYMVAIGSKRSSYWDGSDWTYDEAQAKPMSRGQAAESMLSLRKPGTELWRYVRLVRQPKAEMQRDVALIWPTINGWHCPMSVTQATDLG